MSAQDPSPAVGWPPKVIYLQYHGDGEPDDESPVRDADVTWCRDKIFEHDLEYVRLEEKEPSGRNALNKSGMFKTPPSKQWMEAAIASDEEPEVIGLTPNALNLQMARELVSELPECSCTAGSFIYGCRHTTRRLKECLSSHTPESDSGSEFQTALQNELAKVAEQFAREDPESTDQNFPTMVDAYLRPMLAAVVAASLSLPLPETKA